MIYLRSNFLKIVKLILILFLVLYLLICFLLFFLQEKLIFPLNQQSKISPIVSNNISNIENIELTMNDGYKIRGFFVNNSIHEKANLLIYFGANAEEASQLLDKMSTINNWSVLLINYRGYGLSEGTPSEKVLFSDSIEIFDYFSKREDINNNKIIVMGRSIGTGVASFLASKRNITAVILISPFDSLLNVVKKKLPIFPVNILLKYKFDSISLVSSIKSPVLIMVGDSDKLVPPRYSKNIANNWGGEVAFQEISNVDHNTIDDVEEYWINIREFLAKQE